MIKNAASKPLFEKSGTVPDVSGAMQDYFQPMQFTPTQKTVTGFQVAEVPNPINFQGTWQPLTDRQLSLKPEGQRAWTWYWLHADPVLTLEVDDVVLWNNKQTRVMSRMDFSLYGYVMYHLVQDWTGAGPNYKPIAGVP
jgi:hypothetical protein